MLRPEFERVQPVACMGLAHPTPKKLISITSPNNELLLTLTPAELLMLNPDLALSSYLDLAFNYTICTDF